MRLFDGRSEFYQYDLNQKLICDSGNVGDEIHFSNRFYSKAAVCVTYELDGLVVVDVPNAYLLSHGELTAYRVCCDGDQTSTADCHTFNVVARKRPSDYVYTETEVKSYEALEERIERLENGDFVGGGEGVTGADGKDGITPHIGSNGNWFLGDTDTGVKAEGVGGKDGKDGYTPVKGVDYFDGKDGQDGQNGTDGITPHIGENKNWWIGETDTGVRAEGKDGQDGEGSSSGFGGTDGASNSYSTEETVIGTWVDGKPLYKKTFLTSTPSGTTETTVVDLTDFGHDMIFVKESFICANTGTVTPLPLYISSSVYAFTRISKGTGISCRIPSDFKSLPLYVTIYYTKLADEAVVSTTALMDAYEEGVNEA